MKKTVVFTPNLNEDSVLTITSSVKEFDDYKDMQKIVGGYIELMPIDISIEGVNYDVFINEEGKLIEGMSPSAIIQYPGNFDVIMGPLMFTKSNSEGETISLTENDIEKVKEYVESKMDGIGFKGNLARLPVFNK